MCAAKLYTNDGLHKNVEWMPKVKKKYSFGLASAGLSFSFCCCCCSSYFCAQTCCAGDAAMNNAKREKTQVFKVSLHVLLIFSGVVPAMQKKVLSFVRLMLMSFYSVLLLMPFALKVPDIATKIVLA